jgi:hypothetical protein
MYLLLRLLLRLLSALSPPMELLRVRRSRARLALKRRMFSW